MVFILNNPNNLDHERTYHERTWLFYHKVLKKYTSFTYLILNIVPDSGVKVPFFFVIFIFEYFFEIFDAILKYLRLTFIFYADNIA